MLVDNINLYVKAGNGGNGAATFLKNSMTAKGGPDGGNGGNGGDIYVEGSSNILDLRQFRYQKKIIAEDGIPGKKKKLFGKNASQLTIQVPLGTQITDKESCTVIEITNATPILLAKGGMGGRGNSEFKSATNQTPLSAEKGALGEAKHLLLQLRMIAEIGLVGLPNAGKSSLLKALTNATPKIGDYPFTTLEPNLGMIGKYAVADIPGLIEGASSGKGLGVTFLKHIEKTKILIHCIDVTEEDLLKAYETIRQEFKKYNLSLLNKPEIILLTKSDLVDEKQIKKGLKILEKKEKKVFTCSIYNQENVESLKQTILSLLEN